MNSDFDSESETLTSLQSLDQLIEHSNNISLKVDSSQDSSSPMVATTFLSNGCAQNDETSLVSNGSKAVINCSNGLVDCNPSHSSRTNGNGIHVNQNSNSNNSDIQSSHHNSSHSMAPSLQSWPFPSLSGETIGHSGVTTDGIIFVTNFRVFMSYNSPKDRFPISLSIGMIESIEIRDLYFLYVYSKQVRSFVFSFCSAEDCSVWYKRLTDVCTLESKLENLFCFKFFSSNKTDNKMGFVSVEKQIRNCYEMVDKEFKRMAFNTNLWRISEANKEFKLCSSYPQSLIVPKDVSDKDLESVANFRYSRRIPTIVWRHRKNGCVIARSSQPEVGWLGWRNNHDEHLLQSIAINCNSSQSLDKKLLILDARSYTAAVANRAKGGGCECPEYYLSSEVQFMSLANIHSIRKCYHSLRYICESPADQFNWLTLLDNTKWLHNISGLMKSALIVVNAIDSEERPVLVHCSDGWDRTPQIVALAELMLDPFYRTIDGFRVLIEREWIQFGHKFADRCGNGPTSEDLNERCPVFLQWLDCVHQLVRQFPCSFEFNLNFLIKLIQHSYSCLFGTFICNNMRERLVDHQIFERTHSVWSYFNSRRQQFINYVYLQNDQVLRPSCKAKDIAFWNEVYMPLSSSVCTTFHQNISPETVVKDSISIDTNNDVNCVNGIPKESDIESKPNNLELNESNNETNETESDMDTIASDKHHSLSKTRSCENMINDDYSFTTSDNLSLMKTRHCSDPNLFGSLNIEDQNESERVKSVDILKYIRDLQTDGLPINREISDRESTLLPFSRCSENGLLEDSEPGMSAQFSMLSTETLLNGNPSYVEKMHSCCEPHNSLISNLLTASTSTTELSNSCVASTDLSAHFDKLYTSVYNHKKKSVPQTNHFSIQRQSSNDNTSNNCNGYGKHTRTPSSGCPATPNDEQTFDAFPFESNLSQDVFDIDGHVLLTDKVLVRLQQIIGQNKSEIDYLRRELYLARLALCQQLKYCNGINDETNNYLTNTSHSFEYLAESPSLDSWVDVMPSLTQNNNGFAMNSKCDKNNSYCQSSGDPNACNTSVRNESVDTISMALNHL